MRSIWSSIKNEKGQSIILVALLLVVLCGTTALVVDLSMVYVRKGQLQTAADAAALAAVHDLPNTTTARNSAESYAMKNAAPFIQGQAANVTTHTNNESGVLRTINALLDQRIK